MSENAIKWVLFCLMAATLPVLYFMFVIGGFLPLIAIAAMSFSGQWGNVLINVVHLVIYGLLFYWIAKFLSRKLSLLSRHWKIAYCAGITVALIAISFLPVYGMGHHEYQSVNLPRLFQTYVFPQPYPARATR